MQQQFCPVCAEEVAFNSRIPDYLCTSCTSLITDHHGRPVKLYHPSGPDAGKAFYADGAGNEPYQGDLYVSGTPCTPERTAFGHIYLRPKK